MNFGEIKRDSLRLMGVEADNSDNAAFYLGGMVSAIKRAYDRMVTCKVVPQISVALPEVTEAQISQYTLSELSSGRFCSIRRENDLRTERLSLIRRGDTVKVYRMPKDNAHAYFLAPFGNPTVDDEPAGLPDELCRIIPYFVKSELLEEEEPSLAAQARNIFESLLEESFLVEDNEIRCVKKIYEV